MTLSQLRAVASILVLVSLPARAEMLEGLYFRVGALHLWPFPRSSEVSLLDVRGTARLAIQSGPIAGSAVGMEHVTTAALTLGYRFWDEVSVETILAPPLVIKFTAKGTLASQSLAPYALGTLPTGVPALGTTLGEAKALPPVLTFVYRFFPGAVLRPYLGLGASYLYTYDAHITNPVLTEVRAPKLSVPGRFGWVAQTGLDVRLWRNLSLTMDAKYIGGLHVTASMKDIYVKVPALPLYGSTRVGDGMVSLTVNPLVLQGSLGWNF